MAAARTVCWRFEVGVHAAAFSGVVPVTAFGADADSLCGEADVVSALG
jgi:hypothetical protein